MQKKVNQSDLLLISNLKIKFMVLLLFIGLNVSAQEYKSSYIVYTPASNGYEVEMNFQWKFIDCNYSSDPQINLGIKLNPSSSRASVYIYEGVRYDLVNFGITADLSIIKRADLSGVVFHNSHRLGTLQMNNVTNGTPNCFQYSYNASGNLGFSYKEYRDQIFNLSLNSIHVADATTRDYNIESKIKDLKKKKADQLLAKSHIANGDTYLRNKEYERAIEEYNKAMNLSPDDKLYLEAHINSIKDMMNNNTSEGRTTQYSNSQNNQSGRYNNSNSDNSDNYYEQQLQQIENRSQATDKLATDLNNIIDQAFSVANEQSNQAFQREQQENEQRRLAYLEKKRTEEIRRAEEKRLEDLRLAEEAQKAAQKRDFINGLSGVDSKWPLSSSSIDNPRLYYFATAYSTFGTITTIGFTTVFSIEKQSDGSWPYRSDVVKSIKKIPGWSNYGVQFHGYYNTETMAANERNRYMRNGKPHNLNIVSADFKPAKNSSQKSSEFDNVWGETETDKKDEATKNKDHQFDNPW